MCATILWLIQQKGFLREELTCMARILRGMSSLCCLMLKCHVFILIISSNMNSRYRRPSTHTWRETRWQHYTHTHTPDTLILHKHTPVWTWVCRSVWPSYTDHSPETQSCCGKTLLGAWGCNRAQWLRPQTHSWSNVELTSGRSLNTKQHSLVMYW